MRLYAWQPKGFGQYSWFVMSMNEDEARIAVEKEMERRKLLSFLEDDHIGDYEISGWGTDYYELLVVGEGVVVVNENG